MIRFKPLLALLLLAISAPPALAEIIFAIGEPAEQPTRSGIGQISGWAVSDVEIVSVEALIDGVSLGPVPYGGTRQDVATAFPDFPDSEFSGWSMKWNYSLLTPGEHTLTIVVTDLLGASVTKERIFTTTAFKTAFIADPDRVRIMDAVVAVPEERRIVISGAEVDGEVVDFELVWDIGSQQFQISKITREEPASQNLPPSANAGPNMNVKPGTTTVIEGQAHDPDGFVVAYSWNQISGVAVDLINADQPTVHFVAPQAEGAIRLRLEVTDDSGAHDADDTVISVLASEPENVAPTANAGANRTLQTNETLQIVGQGSDTDGTIVSWAWEQVSGIPLGLQGAATPTVQVQAPASGGEATLRLTVTDDDGATGSDDVKITVEEPVIVPNNAPVANAGPNFTVYTGETVNITGSASDSDGTIVSWSWERVSGLTVTLQNASTNRVRFTAPGTTGTIMLRLTVSDDDGATDSDEVTVTVQNPPPPPNQAPTANAGSDQTVQQGDPVTLSGNGSDPDGSIESWSWQHISGPTVSISNADSQQAGFTAPGTSGDVRIRLTVTDDDGASDTDDVIITVESGSTPDNTTGGTLASMLPVINEARGQARNCGGTAYPAQPPLAWSSSLANIARIHSMDMARHGYFSHTSLDGTSMGNRVFPYWSGNKVAENIAASSIDRSDSYIVNLWLNSAGHCALIMSPNYTHAGVGTGQDPDNGYSSHYFWTLDFGG